VADILYVIDGYVDPGYVVATRDASATLDSNSNITANATRTQSAESTLISNSNVTANATRTQTAQSTLISNSNVTVSASVGIAVTLNSVSAISATANMVGDGATIKVSSGTLTATATLQGNSATQIISNAQINSTANSIIQVSDILYVVDGYVDPGYVVSTAFFPVINAAQINVTADRIRLANSTIQGNTTHVTTATLNATGQSSVVSTAQVISAITVGTQLQFQAQTTLQSQAGVTADAQLNSISNITALAARIRNAQTQFTVISTVNATTGTNQEVTVTLPAVTSTLIISIVYSVDPERIFNILSETRINMIAQETRAQQILSETRKLVVQHTQLVDIAGTPIDRREG